VVTILSKVVDIKLVEDHVTWSAHFYLQVKCDIDKSEVTKEMFEIEILTKRCQGECAHLDLFDKLVAERHFDSFIHSTSEISQRYESICLYRHPGKDHPSSETKLCSKKS
jgi:hypothetical protein